MDDSHSENLRFLLGGAKQFRSTREMWVYFVSLFVMCGSIVLPPNLLGFSLTAFVVWVLGVGCVYLAGWLSWQRWGREVFPLPPDDASDP